MDRLGRHEFTRASLSQGNFGVQAYTSGTLLDMELEIRHQYRQILWSISRRTYFASADRTDIFLPISMVDPFAFIYWGSS